MDYKGIKCPVCEIPFKEGDDVVVCPECGAPYHRDCYKKEGHCVFTEKHEKGEAWEAPAPPEQPDFSAEIKDQECPVCGTLNAKSAIFCNRCGSPLSGEPELHQNHHTYPYSPDGTQNNPQQNNQNVSNAPNGMPNQNQMPPFGAPAPGGVPFFFDPMGGVSPTEMLEDNVTYGDASKLVKQNTQYYMPVFRNLQQQKKNKFNFSAFLFSGGWMLYRKQYKLGGIITGLMFVLYFAYMILNVYVASPLLAQLMDQVGMDATAGFAPSSGELLAMTEILSENPAMYFKLALPLLFLVGMLVIMIVVGIKGNKMYMKHCIKTVQEVKTTESLEEVSQKLDMRGGVNVSIAICLLICRMIISYIPLFL